MSASEQTGLVERVAAVEANGAILMPLVKVLSKPGGRTRGPGR